MASYNGHRSWNAWNVSLWIANDEPMYRCAMSCLNRSKTIGQAVSLFFRECVSEGDKTPERRAPLRRFNRGKAGNPNL